MKQARKYAPVQIKPGMKVRVSRDASHGGLFGAVGTVVQESCWAGEWEVLLPVQVGWGGNGFGPQGIEGVRGAIKEQPISADLLVPIKQQES